ncbi:SusD/RagB family nutrient-binding outer membrane lipoprotein [Mucilaginibacter sp.]|uniref:SusD/RagB family nutrient-binding outer membrane lipoprotein n=1 Tax=Mucilaginibacter sp. TaxID=1882438 RepID=UPI002608DCB3|nr:SusD/RagB family nutrient-binding outer membrane lipoprotein [Mucilaginibacter sp.]MDB5031016.1 SusD/RagB family nutrient-binding outer rane lipoprotein [Mucilaginibacter sp.]
MKKYISIILLTIAIAGSSCKKNFLSLEANPNTPSVASPELQLSGALKTTAGIVNSATASSPATSYGYYTMYAGWAGYIAWATGYQPNTAFEQYIITSSTYDIWTPLYLNLSNYNALIASNPGPNYVGIAKIMTVFNFEALVDNYGNVPYSQALKGTTNLTPAYDKGTAIYDDLMIQLDAAIKMIQNAGTGAAVPGAGDIMYKGNMTNWLKFANTLKLRIALRQSNLAAKTAALKAAVAATQALGYIDATNPGVVNPGYLNSDASGGQQSPLYIAYGLTASGGSSGVNATYQAGSYAADFYGSNNDPRLIQVYTVSTTPNAAAATSIQNATLNVYNGQAVIASFFGADSPPTGVVPPATARANIAPSKFGPGVLKSPTMNANVLSAAESLFLQAEAVAAGYITGNAATLYNAGIAASFADDLVPNAATAAATYAAQPSVAYPVAGSFAAQQQAIITQKWAALNLYGSFEAFNEMRRTGYPAVPTSIYPNANAPNQVTRIPYPFVEYSTNAAAVAGEGTIGIFTSKIFWAK